MTKDLTMINRAVRCGCAGLALGTALLAGLPPALARPPFDGLWSVLIVTERGDCERGYRYVVRVSDGRVRYAGDGSFDVSGKVAANGAIAVTVARGDRRAVGTGRLNGSTGGGTWRGGACSGTWSADRR
jgi:hypothetical protein